MVPGVVQGGSWLLWLSIYLTSCEEFGVVPGVVQGGSWLAWFCSLRRNQMGWLGVVPDILAVVSE